MKSFNILLVILTIAFSCNGQDVKEMKPTISFGAKIDGDNAQNAEKMLNSYYAMAVNDTLKAKFTAKVKDVCKAKGCWMKLELPNGEEAMVRFKDYGFFMPLDIDGKEVVVNGLAFVEEMSVDNQKHYAKDGGKSLEEIEKITEPKRTFGFEANGVLLKQ